MGKGSTHQVEADEDNLVEKASARERIHPHIKDNCDFAALLVADLMGRAIADVLSETMSSIKRSVALEENQRKHSCQGFK